jgi:hypothetical protein
LLPTSILSLFLLLASAQLGSAQDQTLQSEPDIFLVDVIANRALVGDSLEVYEYNDGQAFVDFDHFVEILDLDISGTQNIRSGTLLATSDPFKLDLTERTIRYGDIEDEIDLVVVKPQGEILLVDIHALGKWVKMEIAFNPLSQELTVLSAHPLPYQQEQARKQRQAVLASADPDVSPEDTLIVPNEYQIFTSPQIDLSASLIHSSDEDLSNNNGNLTIAAGFDLIGNAVYYSGSFTGDFDGTSDIQQRLTVQKHARLPNEDILLGFNAYAFGDLYATDVPLLFAGAMAKGIRLSRGDYYNTTKSDTTDVVGDGPPGWEVELYRDDVLLDFSVVASDGRFIFPDISLYYGRNHFVAKLYGPGGETRSKELDFWGGGRPLERGEFRYTLSHLNYQSGIIDDDLTGEGFGVRTSTNLHVDGAVNDWMQLGLGYARAELEDISLAGSYAAHDYIRLNASFNLKAASLTTDLVHQFGQGNALHLSARGAVKGQQLTLTQEFYEDAYSSPRTLATGKVSSRTYLEVSSPLDLDWLNHYAFRLTNQDRSTSGGENKVRLSLNGYAGELFWAKRIEHISPENQPNRVEGDLKISKRYGDFLVRGEANYNSRFDNVVEKVSAVVGWKVSPHLYNQTKVVSTFNGSTETMLDNELTWKPNKFAIAVRGATNFSDNWSLGMRLTTAAGFDQDNKLMLSARPRSGTSNILLRFFIDQNDNGEYDLAEKPVKGVILNKYFARSASNNNGEMLLTNVPTGIPLEIKKTEIALGDPFLKMNKGLIRVYSHSGGLIHADLALTTVGGIEGIISSHTDGALKPVPNQLVQLFVGQKIIARTTTQFDGYFSFEDIPTNAHYILSAVDADDANLFALKRFKMDPTQDYLELGTILLEHRQQPTTPPVATQTASLAPPQNRRRSFKILVD